MESLTDTPRTVSRAASAVLEEAAERRRRTIRLPEDKSWLVQHTGRPAKLLSQMADKRLLYRVGRGRYVVAPRGSFTVQQAASNELIVDLLVGHRGPYYVAFLSALISHRLTDLHSSDLYVAIPGEGTIHKTQVSLPDGTLRFTRLTSSRWPSADFGEIERVRAFDDSKEFWWRSTIERTLVDALNRPELSGGIETVVSAWARAHLDRRADWLKVAEIARRLGPSTERRVAFLLKQLRVHDASGWFQMSGRQANVLFDSSQGFSGKRELRDSETGVLINVPREMLDGWISGAAMG